MILVYIYYHDFQQKVKRVMH